VFLRFLSWLSSRALAHYSVTRTKNFSTRARPAPAASTTGPAASSTRTRPAPARKAVLGSRTRPANAGTRNPRGLTRPAQDSSRHTKQDWGAGARELKLGILPRSRICSHGFFGGSFSFVLFWMLTVLPNLNKTRLIFPKTMFTITQLIAIVTSYYQAGPDLTDARP